MRGLNRRDVVAIVIALAGVRAGAQIPVGADTLSPKAVAESIAVLSRLDDAVRANRNDAAAWYRQGMIAWALSKRAQAKPPIKGLDWIKYSRMADTSLRIAAQIAPKNTRYQTAIGTFLRYAPDPTARFAAVAFLDAATEAARAEPDPAVRAAAVLEAGRVHWLRYDSEAHRRLYLYYPPPTDNPECPHGLPPSIDAAIGEPQPTSVAAVPQQLASSAQGAIKILHNLLLGCTQTTPDAGEADYARAEALFRDATSASPGDPRAFRQLAMLLADKDRWRELEIVARARTAVATTDPDAWLSLGLALHRSHKSEQANAAFDTAIARLSAPERGRLFTFTRLLNSKDSALYAKSAVGARERTEQSFWAMSDPLWSRPGDEPRTEFLARVAFAELRWTVEEMGVRGADSDRGEIYVRYGPPDSIAMLRGADYVAQGGAMSQRGSAFSSGGSGSGLGKPAHSDVITFWDYDNGMFVVFWGAPTYGTARFPVVDGAHVAELVDLRPAAFDNVATEHIDDIPLRTARFRAAADSVDILVFTQAPVKEIRAGTAANAPVREDTWLFGRDVPNAYRDSLTLDATGLNARTYRVPPSAYMYRVEATADGASVAGRATTWVTAMNDTVTGFALRGFGISDLLVATHAEARGTPARWRGFNLTPLLGALPTQSNLELVWENYEFGQRSGQAQYQITLTIQRQRGAAGRIAAQIVGAVAGAVGVNRRDDRVVMQYDRSAAFAPAFVDHITVALADTPAGSYRVIVEITDRVTGRKTNRATEITIR